MRGHDVIQRAASRPTPHLSVVILPAVVDHRPCHRYSMWSHRSRCVRRNNRFHAFGANGRRGCVETFDCTAVTLRKMSCSVPIYLASFVWTIHLTESCSIDFRQKTEMVETSLCVSHPGAHWEMMDMSIRELFFCMFGTFLGLMTHFNSLAQGDVKYSPKKDMDDMNGIWKKETHDLPLLCIRTPVDKGTHSLRPRSSPKHT